MGVSVAALSVSPLAGQENAREIEALRAQLEEMQQQLQRLEEQQARSVREEAAGGAAPTPAETRVAERTWHPPHGHRTGGRENFIDISAIGTFAAGTSTEHHIEDLQGGAHDPQQRGFNVQSLELALSGIVDPYFRAQANVIFTGGGHAHGEGGSGVELEEAFLETLALPGNLQFRAGQFFSEFGRHNTKHLHAWDFVDQPLINGRMFGADGLRNPGARLSWLTPTPFYSELFFAVQNSTGETAYSFRNPEGFGNDVFFRPAPAHEEETEEIDGLRDLLYTTRYAASFDPADAHTLLAGVSAALGPNAPTEAAGIFDESDPGRTEIFGADFHWRWTPTYQTWGFPFVAWQTEAMLRRFHMRNPGETFEDYGFYSQVTYGFTRGWVAGLRYDWVRGDMRDAVDQEGEELEFPDRWRVSPNLTYYPSEFSKIRLQYNHDRRGGEETDHSVWLQFEFSIGPHGAHTF